MVVSVKETKSNPYYLLYEEDVAGNLKKSKEGNYIRRQDCPKVWEYNGSIYVININSLKHSHLSNFKKIKKYVMADEYSIDIDTDLDWNLADILLREKNNI
jgi:N-acylneuraminate cytidylyltransferase